MRQKFTGIRGIIISVFGILGILGFIWYGISNANLDISIKTLGNKGHVIQVVIDWIIKAVNDWFPYVAAIGGTVILLFVIGSWLVDLIWKPHDKPKSDSK